MKLLVKRMGTHNMPTPRYETEGAQGRDLRAALPRPLWVWPLRAYVVPSGFAFGFPPSVGATVRPRSGISMRRGLVADLATIDPDYTGEVFIVVRNLGWLPRRLMPGERIAQLVLEARCALPLEEAHVLPVTSRGASRFGSTGTGADEVTP